MEEAGVGPARRRLHFAVRLAALLLAAVAVAVIVVGFVMDGALVRIGLALLGGAILLLLATSWRRRYLIRKVRWADGTVTIRTVEPGEVGEDGQYVICRVHVNPPAKITRVATIVGPLDAERITVGATLRCLIDRAEGFSVLRVFPYAKPDVPLPSGRVLKFSKA